jgi:hypothetical protein
MLRLMTSGSFAALALLAAGAQAQSGASAGTMQPSRVLITTKDSTMVGRIIASTPLIDSLVRRVNSLPVGSAEFLAANAALEAAFRELPLPAGSFNTVIAMPRRSPTDVVPQGTLGFTADGVNRVWYNPTGNYLQYFEYPTVVAIETNSPASRAGVRSGDLVLAYDGVDVRRNAVNMTQLLTPGRDVTVKLRRDGDLRDIQMTVEKASPALIADRRADAVRELMAAPVAPDERRTFETHIVEDRAAATGARPTTPIAVPKAAAGGTVVSRIYSDAPMAAAIGPASNGVLGAAMTAVDPGLAAAINGMDGKRGVLVTSVPTGSVADRTGLRSGDVILRVGPSDVSTVAQLRVRLYAVDQSGQEKVTLSVLRSGKTLEITYYTR